MGSFNPQEIICFISIFLAVFARMFVFSRIKKRASTKEGRTFIAQKGIKTIVALEAGIILSVVLFILVKTLSLNLGITILLQLAMWAFSISLQSKYVK